MRKLKTKENVRNYRHAVAAAAIAVFTVLCGSVSAQTVSISPKTGNVISVSSYDSEQHEKDYGGAWVHNQLPLTLLTSDEKTLTSNGLMSVHANNIKANENSNGFTLVSGESQAVNHFTVSLPKGYRFTSYKIIMNSSANAGCASTLREMDATFTTSHKTARVEKQGSQSVTMERTSMRSDDMGNILYFRQDHSANKGYAEIDVVSFVVTFECTDRFNEILRPDAGRYSGDVSCVALPFQTQRIDLGKIKQSTENGYTAYKYDYENVKDLQANFLFYDMAGIEGGKAVDGKTGDGCIASILNSNGRTFLGLKNNTYWLETPTEALSQNDVSIPVGYRIVGARVVYSNALNPDITEGSNIYITDGKGNYMNKDLKFTATKAEWTYDTGGLVYTVNGSSKVYLRHRRRPLARAKLETTTDRDNASAFKTDGLTLFYAKDYTVSFDSDGNASYNGTAANVVNAEYQNTSETSFTLKLYDKTGTTVEKEVTVNKDNASGSLILEKTNNDAVKIEVSGLTGEQQAYVCMEVQLEALNPYIDKMDIACTLPSGETKLKQQYLADDFTIGTGGKIDFAVPTNFETANLKFHFEGLNHKKADETYGSLGKQGEYSRYNFVKSEYYKLIGEDLQSHRTEAADYDYEKKIAVDVAGDRAFKCNNSYLFKAGTTGNKTFSYEEYRYSDSKYQEQGGTWKDIPVNESSYSECHLMVCDETRYNIAPTTAPRHASYAYYSTSVKLTREDYEPVITYTPIYNNAMLESGFDSNMYVGATVTLKDSRGNAISEGNGYAYAKQIVEKMKSPDPETANVPADTKHILYLDLSKINALIKSDDNKDIGMISDIQKELATNALIYLPKGVSANQNNLATKAESGDDFNADNNIVLHDKMPFYAPYNIRVNADNEVVYTRNVVKQNDTKKWVSVVLPFTIALDAETGSYEQEADGGVFTFYKMNSDNSFSSTGKSYEVNAHFSKFTGKEETEANVPYLVSIEKETDSQADDGVMFTIRQRGATIVKTPALLDGETADGTVDGSSMQLANHGTYSGVKIDKNEGVFYFNIDKFVSSRNLDERYDDVLVYPFRSYYTCGGNNSVRAIYISTEPNGEPTAIDKPEAQPARGGFAFSAHDGQLTVTAQGDMTATVRNINGQAVESIKLKAGDSRTIQLPGGVYVVNGKKVIVK